MVFKNSIKKISFILVLVSIFLPIKDKVQAVEKNTIKLSQDNWYEKDGSYTVTMEKFTGKTMDKIQWYENDILIKEDNLGQAPYQDYKLSVKGRRVGEYNYYAKLIKGNESIKTESVKVSVEKEDNYKVGVTRYNFIDKNRRDPYAENTSNRDLMVKIWYPAEVESEGKKLDYAYHTEANNFIFDGIKGMEFAKGITSNTTSNPKIAYKDSSFPVLIYSHGYEGLMEENQILFETLAAKGYIVVSINHTYESSMSTLKDGMVTGFDEVKRKNEVNESAQGSVIDEVYKRLNEICMMEPTKEVQEEFLELNSKLIGRNKKIKVWNEDTKFVINELSKLNSDKSCEFYNKLGLDNIGLMGYSFGGAKSVAYAGEDENVKCAINMDGSAYGILKGTKLNKPLLSFASDMEGAYDSNIIYEMNKDKTYLVKIKNSTHKNFTDINTFAIGQEHNPVYPYLELGTINGKVMDEIKTKSVVSFLDKYLKESPIRNDGKNPLEEMKNYDEVIIKSK